MKRKNGLIINSFLFLILSLCVIVIFEFPTIFYYVPLLIFSVWLIYRILLGKTLKLSIAFVLLSIFCIIYVFLIRNTTQDRFYPMYLYFYIALFYFAGTNIITDGKEFLKDKERIFESFYICIAAIFITYVCITLAVDFVDGGIKANLEPTFFWSDYSRPSTDYGVMCLPAIVVAAYLFFCKKAKFIATLLLSVIMLSNFMTQRRTVFLMIPLLFFVCFLCSCIFGVWKKKTTVVFCIGLIVILTSAVIIGFKYKEDISVLLTSDKLGRLTFSNIPDLINNARFISAQNLIHNFSLTYMGGEEYAIQFGNPHNLWLNIYDNAGIIPFILFIIFTICSSWYLFKLCFFAHDTSPKIRCLLVSSYIGMIIQCSIEPVLVSDVTFVMFTFYIFGTIKGFADSADKKYWLTEIIERSRKKPG